MTDVECGYFGFDRISFFVGMNILYNCVIRFLTCVNDKSQFGF